MLLLLLLSHPTIRSPAFGIELNRLLQLTNSFDIHPCGLAKHVRSAIINSQAIGSRQAKLLLAHGIRPLLLTPRLVTHHARRVRVVTRYRLVVLRWRLIYDKFTIDKYIKTGSSSKYMVAAYYPHNNLQY